MTWPRWSTPDISKTWEIICFSTRFLHQHLDASVAIWCLFFPRLLVVELLNSCIQKCHTLQDMNQQTRTNTSVCMANHALEESEQLSGIPLSICLSVCLRKVPCEKQQDPEPSISIMDILKRWALFLVCLSSVFQDEKYWCILGSGECLGVYGFKSLFDFKLLWKKRP